MSVTADRKELLPFLGISLMMVLALPVLFLLEAIPTEGRGKSSVTGYPSQPQTLDLALSELIDTPDIEQKKRDFFGLLKPMIALENSFILQQRSWVQSLDLNQLSDEQKQRLLTLLQEYKLADEDNEKLFSDTAELRTLIDELLLRVSPIPAELVLVQAANESAWGRSRFAREGNNLFGQWCFSRGCGLVPSQRPKGQYHEVAVFKSPQLSIRAYLKNLNSFWAYDDFREARAAKPELEGAEQAVYLAEHLTRYSQRGEAYVRELKEMVQVNSHLIEQTSSEYLR
ncbi:glucosaminidase domain-containing protein [Oceanospirillum sanctuarii]|uniref:glucosaminidase domain-containing protein n=1 Tax=Oceanospirillum sanctuarii TaxID=1434821 RepID=UPI001594CE51|nr:glucosaminidase domain-containing protein [Oceanospirillum sanctuarii]